MVNENVLRLAGLALRAGRLAVGEEDVADACQMRKARLLLLACDAAEGTLNRALHAADESGCVPLGTPWTKEELGSALGRRSCAAAAVTDLGLAQAIAGKLAEEDPDRYGQASERLERKAARASERREKSRKQGGGPAPKKERKK